MVNPFAYEEYRKDKIRQKIEETRAQRVQLKVDVVLTTELTRKVLHFHFVCYSRETSHLFLCFPIFSLHLFLIVWYILLVMRADTLYSLDIMDSMVTILGNNIRGTDIISPSKKM